MAKQPHTYLWQGINKQGQAISGSITESSLLAVKYQLQRQGISPTRVRRQRQRLFSHKNTIKPVDIAMITRQLATMLKADVPLVKSLQLIARSVTKPTLHTLMTQLASSVENGLPLSVALQQFPRQFNSLYCDLVQSGENTGALAMMFEQLAIYREKAEKLKAKIKKAMFYPTMVVLVSGIVTAILLLWVIPQFEEMYNNFGAPLPWFTQWVIALSRGLQQYGGYLVIALLTAGIFYRYCWRRSARLRHQQDRALLRLPVLGSILRKAALTGFARTLATTFAAGIPLIDGLIQSANATGNHIYRLAVLQVREQVMTGMPIHQALACTQLFPEIVVQMVMIGEETGALDDTMYKVASIYEREVDDAIEGLTNLIEPFMMLILGVLVGGLVIAMYLPIFNLGSVIH